MVSKSNQLKVWLIRLVPTTYSHGLRRMNLGSKMRTDRLVVTKETFRTDKCIEFRGVFFHMALKSRLAKRNIAGRYLLFTGHRHLSLVRC